MLSANLGDAVSQISVRLAEVAATSSSLGWRCSNSSSKGARRTRGWLLDYLQCRPLALSSHWQIQESRDDILESEVAALQLLHHLQIHEASVKSYRRPLECRCHAAQAAHDWWSGIIHVQHHADHAGNDSLRMSKTGCLTLHQHAAAFPSAYSAVASCCGS